MKNLRVEAGDTRLRGWTIAHVLHHIVAPAMLIQGRDDHYSTLDRIAAHLTHKSLAGTGQLPPFTTL